MSTLPLARPVRRPWNAVLRLLERDERLFAVLLTVVMVGGLATLGLAPLRARFRVDIYSLVMWFAAYKLGVLALVTVSPHATRRIFIGALGVDLLLVFALLFLTGGGDSPFVNLFFPLVAINAYYFGRGAGLFLTAPGRGSSTGRRPGWPARGGVDRGRDPDGPDRPARLGAGACGRARAPRPVGGGAAQRRR